MTGSKAPIFAVAAIATLAVISLTAQARQEKAREATGAQRPKLGYKDTPMLPGGKWHVHDGDRPQPRVIRPGTCRTQDAPGQAPSDAVVLFDGTDLAHWGDGRGGEATWKVQDGAMVAQAGGGPISSKDEFGDCQLHIEFATPDPPTGRDQGRGNSGVMFFGLYEIQVLDSFENQTYPDGQAAAIYGQHPPLVNASRGPGQWQSYDILFTAPRFKSDGSVETPAYVTMLHNGVLVHNHTPVLGAVAFRDLAKYTAHGPRGRISLQDHGNPVRFRNIWVREIKGYDEP
jgi:hypothetical protein